ncbi:hypothetical protein B0G77_3614 [Paraburkholderia sp. BL10I2N1]|nr:hypothetical protein B0G77_3614 [Paraburkholderia sp. BL10I2N1]
MRSPSRQNDWARVLSRVERAGPPACSVWMLPPTSNEAGTGCCIMLRFLQRDAGCPGTPAALPTDMARDDRGPYLFVGYDW